MDKYSELFQLVVGVAGVLIPLLLYKLNLTIRRDNWAKVLREFHYSFWNDDDMKKVRMWIALDSAYEDVQPIFKKRKNNEPLTEDEYDVLEKMDRFAALLLAYKNVAPNNRWHRRASKRLFDEYWLTRITQEDRSAMYAYMQCFYEELIINSPTRRSTRPCASRPAG
jgi:hypothetical protein